MWYSFAAAHAEAITAVTAVAAAKARDELAAKMTPDQIAEAQRLAREWKPTE
jgi:hypothetical protein